jgi:hypothetical protein
MNTNTLILFTRSGMGDAPGELQHKLVGTFLKLLGQDSPPGALAFYGNGVKLVCEGSPVLEHLSELERKGAHLIICQTCLDYFGLRDQVRVGIVAGMGDIVEAMAHADKVISV